MPWSYLETLPPPKRSRKRQWQQRQNQGSDKTPWPSVTPSPSSPYCSSDSLCSKQPWWKCIYMASLPVTATVPPPSWSSWGRHESVQGLHGSFRLPPWASGALTWRPSPVPILLAMALLKPQLGDNEKFYICRWFISRLCDILLLFRKQPRTLNLKVTIILPYKRHNFILWSYL